jgi:NTE family protein
MREILGMRADGVFSGGGIKGLAFAGALQAADEAGYNEWMQVAGTSAGAITAMALAVGYDAQGLRQQLDRFDFSKIADYGAPLGIGEAENFLLRRGLTQGKVLHEWIRQLLADAPNPATTFGELGGRLRVVGSDLAHARMVVFPEDVALYLDKNDRPLVPDEFPIADAVRISAGYPYFFPPLTLRDALTTKDGVLVDGGVCSAFPIFLFDHPQPQHPTWGYRLFGGSGSEHPTYHSIDGPDWPLDMLRGVLDTSMNALDKLEMKEFQPRTISIPTGAVPTLEFALTKEQKDYLYQSGYETARAFFGSNPSGRNTFGAVPPTQSQAQQPQSDTAGNEAAGEPG